MLILIIIIIIIIIIKPLSYYIVKRFSYIPPVFVVWCSTASPTGAFASDTVMFKGNSLLACSAI
jgi:hypothetical protein